ncbi:hypothetical protein ACLOJK_041105 [Asimina triloba]
MTNLGSNPPQGDPAPISVPHGDPESKNSELTMRSRGAARLSHNLRNKKGSTLHERLTQQEQQKIEVTVQGQATVGTQEGERAVTQSRMTDVGGDTSRGYHTKRLSRKKRDWKDANNFHQQHPPSFFGGESTKEENWLLAISKILEFLDYPDRKKVLFVVFKLEGDAYRLWQTQKRITENEEARIRRFQNGLNESIWDMVMAEPCKKYGKVVDRAMWAEKAVT